LSGMSAWQPRTRPAPTSPLATISGTKWIVDGTPIERLMVLRAPYADMPGTKGRLNFSADEMRQFLRRALDAREQPLFHAVGDGAIAAVLDALEATGGERWKPLRPRIEHGDMLGSADLARAARLGVVVVQNPAHFMIADTFRQRVGDRIQQSTRVKDIAASGVTFALGSDGPLNPFLNMMFATINAVNPPQALTVEQALVAYTAGSAAAEHAEDRKGRLQPGMLADLAVLSQDIFKVPAPELPKTSSVLTIVDGRIVVDRITR
jgi:predicted amidohydrolase YtcJ